LLALSPVSIAGFYHSIGLALFLEKAWAGPASGKGGTRTKKCVNF